MAKLLFEVGTEELPPASVVPSADFLADTFRERAREARLQHGAVRVFATPRRLAIRVDDVVEHTDDLVQTKMGPSSQIAFDAEGNPTRAAAGFARGAGVSVGDLIRIDTEKGQYVGARVVIEGQAAESLVSAILTDILKDIPWPRPMRWGWSETSWGRPVHWMVAMLDSAPLSISFAGVESGKRTLGHRFMNPKPHKIPTPNAYEAVLKRLHVIASVEERRSTILEKAKAAVAPDVLVFDAQLLNEVTQLVEWPVVLVGEFDAKYLALPREVLISEMKEHQRYFAVEDQHGHLTNKFVVIANTEVRDPDLVLRGNLRVLVARLSDAEFFLKRDRARPLASRVNDLEKVVYLQKLGSMRDKVDRIVGLAAYLGAFIHKQAARHARRAALLCKADLTTNMVGEFPELQGAMGREYALRDGEPNEVAVAIDEHYKPRSASDSVAQTPAGIIVALADKVDTIAGCFALGLQPTGTADPYGLRRAALGIIRTSLEHKLVFPLERLISAAVSGIGSAATRTTPEVTADILAFIERRLKSTLSSRYETDMIDAVLAAGINDLPSVVERIEAFAGLRDNADFEPLAVAFKRVKNILKTSPTEAVNVALFSDGAEVSLWQAHESARAAVRGELRERNFRGAAEQLIGLKPHVDRFFDDVMVMVEDEAIRTNRLALLRELRSLFEELADISRIQVKQ